MKLRLASSGIPRGAFIGALTGTCASMGLLVAYDLLSPAVTLAHLLREVGWFLLLALGVCCLTAALWLWTRGAS